MSLVRRLVVLALLVMGLTSPVPAAPTVTAPSRQLLYLYDSRWGETERENDGVEQWAAPCARLGLSLVVRDTAAAPPPPPSEARRWAGILAPTGAFETSEPWCTWLGLCVAEGVKVVVVAPLGPGDPEDETSGAASDEEYPQLPDAVLNRVYEPLGFKLTSELSVLGDEGGGAGLVHIRSMAPGWFGYQAPLTEADCPWYTRFEALTSDVEPLLVLDWQGAPETASAVVALCPRGALAVEEYVKVVERESGEVRWRVDPVRFLERALGLEGWPRPETDLVAGRRVLLVHVGGVGATAPSTAVPGRTCGEVLVDEILARPPLRDVAVTLTGCRPDSPLRTLTASLPAVRLTTASFRFMTAVDESDPPPRRLGLAVPLPTLGLDEYVAARDERPFGALMAETGRLERGERPCLTAPVVAYVEYDAVETLEGLDALRRGLAWLAEQPLAALPVEEWLLSTVAARETAVSWDGGRRLFVVRHGPGLRTLRFDVATGWPDLARSRGVVGFCRRAGSLYCFLGEGGETEVALCDRAPDRPYVMEATGDVTLTSVGPEGVEGRASGPPTPWMRLGGLPPSRAHTVTCRRDGLIVAEWAFKSDAAGVGEVAVDVPGGRVAFAVVPVPDEHYLMVFVRRFLWDTGAGPWLVVLALVLVLWAGFRVARLVVR